MLQKLRPFGLSGGGDESTDSIDSSLSAASNLSEQENNLESASPQVDGTCQFEQGGMSFKENVVLCFCFPLHCKNELSCVLIDPYMFVIKNIHYVHSLWISLMSCGI